MQADDSRYVAYLVRPGSLVWVSGLAVSLSAIALGLMLHSVLSWLSLGLPGKWSSPAVLAAWGGAALFAAWGIRQRLSLHRATQGSPRSCLARLSWTAQGSLALRPEGQTVWQPVQASCLALPWAAGGRGWGEPLLSVRILGTWTPIWRGALDPALANDLGRVLQALQHRGAHD